MTPDKPTPPEPATKQYSSERNVEEFWREVRPKREPIQQRWFIPAVLIILAVSVPWYWPSGETGKIVGGLPLWIWITLGCSVLIASLTAYVGLFHWDDDEFETHQSERK